MATHRGVEVAAAAVAGVLRDAFDPALVPGAEPLRFHLVGPEDLSGGLPSGLGVLVYAVEVDPAGRNLDAGPDRPGPRVRARLLVLVGAAEVATRLVLAGWTLRTLHDTSILPAELLNREAGGEPVFGDGETARVVVDPLDATDLLRRLEILGGAGTDVLALPYVVEGFTLG